MLTRVPTDLPADLDDQEPGTLTRKSRSTKQFLLTSVTVAALGLGLVGVLFGVAIVARQPLAEAGIEGFLRGKGIDADIDVVNLQLGSARIRDVRLGPVDKPTVTAKSADLLWHYDKDRKLLILDSVQIDGAVVNLSVDKAGKVDFGALAPLLVPGTGAKTSVINGVRVTNALANIQTPFGVGKAQLEVWGGETTGWAGRGDLTPPAQFIAAGSPFAPIRVGFAARTAPKTEIGFHLRPSGQSLTYQTNQIENLRGTLSGKVTLEAGNGLRIDTRRSSLQANAIKLAGTNVSNTNLQIEPIFWQQGQDWATTGWGSGAVGGSFDGLKIGASDLRVGNARFTLGAARSEGGRMQLDYDVEGLGIDGPARIGRAQVSGNITTTARDLTKLAEAELIGRSNIAASQARIPASITRELGAGLPPQIADILSSNLSAQTTLRYSYKQGKGLVSLDGPLAINSATGANLTWAKGNGPSPALMFESAQGQPIKLAIVGSGQIGASAPGLGAAAARLDGFSINDKGLAFAGRSGAITLAGPMGLRGNVDRFDLRWPKGGLPSGEASGRFEGSNADTRANLAFAVAGNPRQITANLSGPISGLGASMESGDLSARVRATRLGQAWDFATSARLGARALGLSGFKATNSTLNFGANGRVSSPANGGPQISAKAQMDGLVGQASISGADGTNTIRNLRFDNRTRATGNLQRINLVGDAQVTGFDAGGLGLRVITPKFDIGFNGVLAGGGLALTGALSSGIGQVTTSARAGAQALNIEALSVAGPVQVQVGQPQAPSPAPFWNGALALAAPRTAASLSADLKVSAKRLEKGDNQINNLALSGHVSASRSNNIWTADGRLIGSAANAAFGTNQLAGLRFTAPFEAQAGMGRNSNGLQVTSNLSARANRFTSGETLLQDVNINAPLIINLTKLGGTSINARDCIRVNAAGGTFPGETRAGAVNGKLCPNNLGRIASLGTSGVKVLGEARLDPFSIQMGSVETGQSIEIGEVTGSFSNGADGNINLALLASQFGLNVKLPDGNTALVKANEAELNILPSSRGIGLKGRLGRISAVGLPILLSGGTTADFLVGPQGLSATIDFDDLTVKDAEPLARFGAFKLSGSGLLSGNQFSMLAQAQEPISKVKLADLTFGHDIKTGDGSLDVAITDLTFSPNAADPTKRLELSSVIPPLTGVITDLEGVVNGSANFAWSRSGPIRSSATIDTNARLFNTQLGQVNGVTGKIKFDDLLLGRTAGVQTIEIGLLNTGGIPIENGVVKFALPGNNTLRLEDASWPFAEGRLSVRPATWAFRDGDQAFAVDVEDVDLAKLLRLTDVPNLEIDGKVSGVFPIEVRNGNVEIVGGRLKAREGGGMIRYTGPNTAPPPPPLTFGQKLRQRFFGKPPPMGADLAIEALRALEYKILEITVDGRITGELKLGVILQGANQQVLSGVPFKFNIKMNVPIGQLLDNVARFNDQVTNPRLLEEYDRALREDAAQPTPAPTEQPPVPRVP